MWYIHQASNVGVARKEAENQDSIGSLIPGTTWNGDPLLIVADGMGGHQGGAIASQIVVETIIQSMRKHAGADPATSLRDSIQQSHSVIRQKGGKDSDLQTMGSTIVAVVLKNDRLILANVGDSRAYRIRAGQITQISFDHSKVAELVRNNLITPEQAKVHPQRNQLIMSISAQRETIDPYIITVPVQPQDIILLCSDGLWGVVPEEIILGVAENLPPQQAVDRLIELANKYGGPDNISVSIARQEMPKAISKKEELEDTLPAISVLPESHSTVKPKKFPVWVILVGALVLVIIGVIIGVRLVQNNTTETKPTPNIGTVPGAEAGSSQETQTVTTNIESGPQQNSTDRVRATDNMTMVFISGGEINLNGTITQVPGFWLDQTFVTIHMFEQCMNSGSCQAQTINPDVNSALPMLPNETVDAQTYCTWVGARLPTIEEWRLASQVDPSIQADDFPSFPHGFRCAQDNSVGIAP